MPVYNPVNLNFENVKLPCHEDYAKVFVSVVLTAAYKRKENAWTPLNALLLRKLVHAKKTEVLRKTLIEHNIIDCDEKYCPGEKSKGYRLNKKYRTYVRRVSLTSKSLSKKYTQKEPELVNNTEQAIWKWLNALEIDYKACQEELKGKRNITQRSLSLEKAHTRDFFLTRDARGRIYHNIVSLWSVLRSFLSIKSKKLITIDIRNSQPLIFSVLLKQSYLSSLSLPYKVAPVSGDVKEFISLVESGDLYDYLMDETENLDRRRFKKAFFSQIFYGPLDMDTDLTWKFKTLFPTVAKVIAHHKRDDYRNLPLLMQKIEADIMINTVCKQLSELPHIPFLPIHDSILTTPECVDEVKSIIFKAFGDIGLSPTFG